MFGALQTAGSGMNVFRTWLDATANNVANMQSINLTPGGEPFKTELVIAASAGGTNEPGEHGARVVQIVHADETARPKFEPDNPLADPETGEVKYPGVDLGEQMVNAVAAQRGYQANVSVLQYARDAYQSALRLGK